MSKDLISLRANIERAELQHTLFRVALESYLEALEGVESRVFETCAAKIGEPSPTVEPARRQLKEQPGEESFGQARTSLAQALETTQQFIQRELAGAVDLAEVLRVLAETAASLARRSSEHESRFRNVASGLQTAAEKEDVAELRQQICMQIQEITRLVDEMKQENRQIVSGLEAEMQQYRQKLDEVERLAQRDTLTGLANRRYFEQCVMDSIQSGVPFCLLLLDLNHFKQVNDQHGHLAGDELLKHFAARLRRQLRPDDTAARWGGDEFVVLLPCKLSDAMVRARFLEQSLLGDYNLSGGAKPVRVRIGLSMGVAEYHAGETFEQLIARADQVLYQRKGQR